MEPTSPTLLPSTLSNRTLIIMAKAPRPGAVKTRLTPSLPSAAVLALYRCLLEDTLALTTSLTAVQVVVVCPEPDEHEMAELVGNRAQVMAQQGEGLAAGLLFVFRHFTAAGGQQVIVFGSDTPHLPPSVLQNAFEILSVQDIVIGPTSDGGYYLVGAKAAHSSLFASDGLGTASALERLLARTKALKLSTGFTQPFYDIDVANDLLMLARELRLAPEKAPRTANWLAEWHQAVAQLEPSPEGR